MNEDIRRKDREMKTSQEMERLLEKMPVGRLGIMTKNGPYVVPMNFLFFEGHIYLHSALSGRKMESLRADSRVCFLVDDVGSQVLLQRGCGISQIYRSVLCFGKAEWVEDPVEKMAILERMVQKYVPPTFPFPHIKEQNVETTAVVRIVIESMKGKAHELSPSHTVLPDISL